MIDFVDKVSEQKMQLGFKESAKINEVRASVSFSKGIKDTNALRRFFNGKEMEDHARLNSYGIEKAEIKRVYLVGIGNIS